MNVHERYDFECLRAELHDELRAVRALQDQLQRKINRIDATNSVFLLRKVAALEAQLNGMRAQQAARDERRRAWGSGTGKTAL